MKLIMENWRNYQEQTLLQEGVVDYIKNGFKKLMSMPDEFDSMVEEVKTGFAEIFRTKLEELLQDSDIQAVGADIADAVIQSEMPAELREEFEASATKKQFDLEDIRKMGVAAEEWWWDAKDAGKFSLQELRKMGVSKEAVELIANSVARTGAEAVIESAESVVGKAVPPRIRDFFVRFVSKFIGSFVFGFIDNFIMVMAGSQIDAKFGGIAGGLVGSANAPMMAAGLGNTVSDAVGELASNTIEGAMGVMGLNPQAVSDEQMQAAPAWMKFLDKNASVFGIILGCLVGLFPLFLEEEIKNETVD